MSGGDPRDGRATSRLCRCGCGRSLAALRADARYYSDACRAAAYRARRGGPSAPPSASGRGNGRAQAPATARGPLERLVAVTSQLGEPDFDATLLTACAGALA